MSPTVRIFDTTLRDGEQTPGVHVRAHEKVEIARRIETFGVDTIEAGFPASSPGDFDAVRRVAESVRECEVAALGRCTPADIDAAADALAKAVSPVVHVVLGVSDIHLERKLGISRADALRTIEACVRRARNRAEHVEFSLEDATRADRAFLRQCVGVAVDAGATRINIADTVGCALPWEFGALIRDMAMYVEDDVIVSAHCHNDLGMATANSISAVVNGARQVEGTINGIGERAGNTAIEEFVVACHLKGVAATRANLGHIYALGKYVMDVVGVSVQPNKAIVGANAFAHSSGIHQDGVLKDPANYEFVPPSLVGAPGHQIVLTARSGRHAIGYVAAQMGVAMTVESAERVFNAFKRVADEADGEVSHEELMRVIEAAVGKEHAYSPIRK